MFAPFTHSLPGNGGGTYQTRPIMSEPASNLLYATLLAAVYALIAISGGDAQGWLGLWRETGPLPLGAPRLPRHALASFSCASLPVISPA